MATEDVTRSDPDDSFPAIFLEIKFVQKENSFWCHVLMMPENAQIFSRGKRGAQKKKKRLTFYAHFQESE
jgi:hypothetical protein